MPRFSLSPIKNNKGAIKRTSWSSYRLNDDTDGDSDSDSDSTTSENSDSSFSESEMEEEEPDHPLGFSNNMYPTSFGVTRFGLFDDNDDDENEDNTINKDAPYQIQKSQRPPQSQKQQQPQRYLHTSSQTNTLLRHHNRSQRQQQIKASIVDDEDDIMGPLITNMERIAQLIRESTIIPSCQKIQPITTTITTSTTSAKMQQAAMQQNQAQSHFQNQMKAYEQGMNRQHRADANLLLGLITKEKTEVALMEQEEVRQQEIEDEKIRANEEERRRIQEGLRLREEEAQRQESVRREEMAKQEQERLEREKLKREKNKEEEEKQKIRAAKKVEHVTRAKKCMEQLKDVRSSLVTFETSKDRRISSRRLQMKKIAKGKLNTLTTDPGKIQGVCVEIFQAILNATQEDAAIKEQLNGGSVAVTKDMARGSRYLMDLITSTVIARVQSDQFNGSRGDGFPIANMLALLSAKVPSSFSVLWNAHLYTACPTAIPILPKPAPNCTETELMDSLGMHKDEKTGEYESFDKFLSRTEGLVSIMAEIMCSMPPEHELLSGHNGALKWLIRFLDLLPSEQTPLPLLTAPVLVAFLTAAGHMLANKFEKHFRPLLDKIIKDISKRLDTSTIGQPSATRLSKLLSGGFDHFKNNLPPGAVKGLYDASSSTSTTDTSIVNNGGMDSTTTPNQLAIGAMGQNNQPAPSPFGDNQSSQPGQSPFGNQNNPPSTNPFGGGGAQNNQPAQSPFGGGGAQSNQAAPNPFGGGGAQSNQAAPNPFGGGAQNNQPAQISFGGGGAQSNQAAPNQFGGGGAQNNQPVQSPFGGAQSNQPAQSPFGGAQSNQPAPNPFGGAQNNQPAQSPFGGAQSNQPVQSPFGGGAQNNQPAQSPFGGQNNQPAQSPFGGKSNSKNTRPPCKFFAEGRCRNGANCNFSHDIPSSNNQCTFVKSSNGGNQSNRNANGGGQSNRNNGTKTIPCRFFAQGNCRFGDNCKYSHDIPSAGGGNKTFGQLW